MELEPHTNVPIHLTGIWRHSQCLEHEQSIISAITERLGGLGYQSIDDRQIFWQRHKQKIVVCLVDDVRHAAADYSTDVPYLFDSDTTVITDNQILCPTRYRVINLPKSFFGIYHHHAPDASIVDRQFSFLINRLDHGRFLIMLELAKRISLHQGYVNFNCQKDRWLFRQDIDLVRLRQNFEDSWQQLDESTQHHYHAVYDALKVLMPLKNYDITHDEAMLRSRCNIIVESYTSDNVIAFSEKIFRALMLPVPWTLYGGMYSVARLESLGFDCISDIVDHQHYDRLKQIEDKVHIFVWKTLDSLRLLDQMDCKMLADRCRLAAQHNQQLLKDFHQNWPRDFANWLANTAQLL